MADATGSVSQGWERGSCWGRPEAVGVRPDATAQMQVTETQTLWVQTAGCSDTTWASPSYGCLG